MFILGFDRSCVSGLEPHCLAPLGRPRPRALPLALVVVVPVTATAATQGPGLGPPGLLAHCF